jgi:putative ABC transport system permease protein
MGIPLIKGRVFTERDGADAPLVLVINQTMAELIWPDEEPVGQRISFEGPEGPWFEIVGVVGDTKHFGLDEAAKGAMYTPYPQKAWPWMSWMTFVLRTSLDPQSLVGSVRQELRGMDPELPVTLRTLEQQVASSVADRRFNLLLLGSFAAVALLLTAVGIYGVVAYAVARRAHEIGIRMALGAEVRDVLGLVVGQGMHQVLLGVAIGLAAAFASTRLMSSLLFGVSAADPTTFATVSLFLIAVSLAACTIPARRAAAVDPLVALRHE